MDKQKVHRKTDNSRHSVTAHEATLEEREKEIDELKSRMKYLQADFENLKKHMERERAEFERQANEKLMMGLLVIVDDLERAAESVHSDSRSGIEMILGNLRALLEKNGLKRIDALGRKFDPYYHEAVLTEKSDKEEGTVTAELQPGYMLNSRVIRHSKVRIAKD